MGKKKIPAKKKKNLSICGEIHKEREKERWRGSNPNPNVVTKP
jgi:hypothetical protein